MPTYLKNPVSVAAESGGAPGKWEVARYGISRVVYWTNWAWPKRIIVGAALLFVLPEVVRFLVEFGQHATPNGWYLVTRSAALIGMFAWVTVWALRAVGRELIPPPELPQQACGCARVVQKRRLAAVPNLPPDSSSPDSA